MSNNYKIDDLKLYKKTDYGLIFVGNLPMGQPQLGVFHDEYDIILKNMKFAIDCFHSGIPATAMRILNHV